MSGQFWLADDQVERRRLHVPKARGKPRIDDWRVLSGILHVLQRAQVAGRSVGLRTAQDPSHNRFARWSRLGAFARTSRDLARSSSEGDT